MSSDPLETISRLSARKRARIATAEPMALAGLRIRVVTTDDLIAMKHRAAADPERRRSKALRDEADVALLRGDVPDPVEGW